MTNKQASLTRAIATRQEEVDRLTSYDEELRASVAQERERLATIVCAEEGYDASEKQHAETKIRGIESQLEDNQRPLKKAQVELERLRQAQGNEGKAATASKAGKIREQIGKRQTELAQLDEQNEALITRLMDDPANDGIQEDLALNNEKRAAIVIGLKPYERALETAKREDAANTLANVVKQAFTFRDHAVSAARTRVQVAEKIDKYLAGLAPLMREWRDADVAVHKAVVDSMRAAYSGAKLNVRENMLRSVLATARANSIAPAVAYSLVKADVFDVTGDLLEVKTGGLEYKREMPTGKELAQTVADALSPRLDDAISRAGSTDV